MRNLCIHAFYESSRLLFSTLSHAAYIGNSYDWAQHFDKLKRAPTSISEMCFLWNILRITNSFNVFEDFSSLFNKLLPVLVEIDTSGNLVF